jgi:hypothetical protein
MQSLRLLHVLLFKSKGYKFHSCLRSKYMDYWPKVLKNSPNLHI